MRPRVDAGMTVQQSTSNAWIVVPAYNEATRLPKTLASLREYRNLVVVDDGSTDGTADAALVTNAWLLRHSLNCGQGAALRTGIQFALQHGAAAIVTFDADGQHDPAEIPRLLGPVLDGTADVVLGSRFLGRALGMPRGRRLLLRAAALFTRAFSGIRVTDAQNGFRALSREAALRIQLAQDRMAHASEILDQIAEHRLRFREVPVTVAYDPGLLAKGQRSSNAIRIVGHLLLGRMMW